MSHECSLACPVGQFVGNTLDREAIAFALAVDKRAVIAAWSLGTLDVVLPEGGYHSGS
jgi:hypothetical protein